MLFAVQYMLPFMVNQSGSVLYYITLSSVGKQLCNVVYSKYMHLLHSSLFLL